MTDNYCFICGHYLADAWSLNDKNKKFYLGDHTSNNKFESTSVSSKEPIIYEYSDKTEILYHSECHDILEKDCKYTLKWDDVSENIEPRNSHGLIPYTNLERPVDNSKIKTVVKWSKTQIIEEWEHIISEIREKTVELKNEKKDILQMKRESRREALRKQRQKKKDKIESLTTKIEKIVITIEKDKQSVLDKEDKMRDVKSEFKITQAFNQINKLNLKVSKNDDLCKKEEDKLILLNKELDMFIKAWF